MGAAARLQTLKEVTDIMMREGSKCDVRFSDSDH